MARFQQADSRRTQRIYSTRHGDLVLGRRCLVMGILNVTPDSFSDGGRHLDCDAAIRRAIDMVREGADVIDVGGESTRPGSRPVSPQAQIDRIAPVIRGIRSAGLVVPISVDTQSAEVADVAMKAGADIINDISAVRDLRATPNAQNPHCCDNSEMMRLLAAHDMPFVIMHMQGTPATMQTSPAYTDVVADVAAFFDQRARALESAGVATEGRMIVDPGIGFGKTLEHNLALVRASASYGAKWPVLLGTSRKRFLGEILSGLAGNDEAPGAEERVMGTAATIAYAALAGVDMVRVHDVRAMREVIEVCRRLTD